MGNCCGPAKTPFEPQIEDKRYLELGKVYLLNLY